MDEDNFDDTIEDQTEDLPDVKDAQNQGDQGDTAGDDAPKGNQTKKYPHFTVAVNEQELSQGFQAPFTVSIVVDPEFKKGDLLKAIVDGMNKISSAFDKPADVDKYTALYRKWACRTFNLSDRAFNSVDGLTEETSKVENSFVDAMNAQPTVEQLDPVPIIGFGDKGADQSEAEASDTNG